MKSNSTRILSTICVLVLTATTPTKVSAQIICSEPIMTWENPVLTSGTAGAKNAVYKFPLVQPGVNAFITITDIQGGATLTSIDDNTYGYSQAWQPVVRTPQSAPAGESYVAFKIEFFNLDGSQHQHDCFQLSFIDVDGDNDKVSEFVAASGWDLYTVSNVSTLTLTQQNGLLKANGSVTNYAGIDTAAYSTNINYHYINDYKINEVRIGNKVQNGYTVQDRFTCGYFRDIAMHNVVILPVKYLYFTGAAADNAVNLKWATEMEMNNDHFEVERSFDGNSFKTIGLALDGFAITGSTGKKYQFKDNSVELKGKTVAYYRLKQIDLDGKSTYSVIIAVTLASKKGVDMQVSPNPFVQDLFVHFNSSEPGTAEIRIVNVAGQTLLSKQVSISKGYNNMHVEGLSRLAAGMYVAQLVMNGNVIDNQKIVKN